MKALVAGLALLASLVALSPTPRPLAQGASVTATWEGRVLRVEWAGPGCLYYERPLHKAVWLTCDAGAALLSTGGGDATRSAEVGGRLWVSDGRRVLAETVVGPRPVVLPIVAQQ